MTPEEKSELQELELQAQTVATKPIIPRRFGHRNIPIPLQLARQQEGEKTLQEIQGYKNLQRRQAEQETLRAQELAQQRGDQELLNLAFEERASGRGSGLSYFYGR